MDLSDEDTEQLSLIDELILRRLRPARLLSSTDPLYIILGRGIHSTADEEGSSSDEDSNSEETKGENLCSTSTKVQAGRTSNQMKTTECREDENPTNVWKYIRRKRPRGLQCKYFHHHRHHFTTESLYREIGLDIKGDPTKGFSESDKSNVFSRYLPNTVTEVIPHRAKVFCGNYSQDGSVFMSASQDFLIKLYETSGGQLREFQNVIARNVGWSIVDTAYSHDQRHLIYSGWSPNIYLCDIAGGCEKQHTALDMRPEVHSFCAFSIKFSQDDTEILTGSNDGSLYVYDRGCAKRTLRIHGHDDDVNTVCFCDNTSQLLFSGSDDGLCKVWDRRTLDEHSPEPVGTFAGHACGIACIDSKGDGRYLITSSKDQTIKLWDMRKFTDAQGVTAGARTVAGNQFWDYRWEVLPKKFRKGVHVVGDASVMTYRGHSLIRCLIRARFSPLETTGQKYIYTGSADGRVYIYDLHSGKIVRELAGHMNIVRDVSWHPTKPYIMTSSWDCSVKCWQYSRNKDETERSDKEIQRDESEELTKRQQFDNLPRGRLFGRHRITLRHDGWE